MRKKQTDYEYGFQPGLPSDFPSHIMFDVTEVCNLSCIHCPYGEFSKSDKFTASRLSIELHHKMIDEIKWDGQQSCRCIRYTGLGGTLTNPDLPEMLEYAKSSLDIPLTVTTNGTLLNKRRIKHLLDCEVHSLDISIDAFHNDTYAEIRRGGDLKEVKDNVQSLLREVKIRSSSTKIFVSFVEQDLNKSELTAFEDFWNRQGVDKVLIRRAHENAGSSQSIVEPQYNHSSRYPCLYPWERLILAPDGSICYCPIDWVKGSVIADFNHVSVKEVWSGKEMQALRQAHLSNNFSCHKFCGACKDWSTTTWPHHEHGKPYSALF